MRGKPLKSKKYQVPLTRLVIAINQSARTVPTIQLKAKQEKPLLSVIFRVVDLDEMSSMGLFVNDLNLFDNSRDKVMAGHHHASRLEDAIEKVRKCVKIISELL